MKLFKTINFCCVFLCSLHTITMFKDSKDSKIQKVYWVPREGQIFVHFSIMLILEIKRFYLQLILFISAFKGSESYPVNHAMNILLRLRCLKAVQNIHSPYEIILCEGLTAYCVWIQTGCSYYVYNRRYFQKTSFQLDFL